LAAGSLANTAEILDGLAVFPDAMRANLLTDGGMIMAEAVMFRLAPRLGRSAAHDLVYDACTVARERRMDLREALRATLEPGQLVLVEPLDEAVDPARYLGEVDSIVNAALAIWGGRPKSEGRA
jgi:adenylosuccinate lyase